MEYLVIAGCGLFAIVAGILVLIRENRLFKKSIKTKGLVKEYYEYQGTSGTRLTMYTMVVEYRTTDGEIYHSKEQKGSSRKKYPEGTVLDIVYSCEKPDFFIVSGDNSRKIAMVGMILFGVAAIAISIYAKLTNYYQ